VRRDHRRQHRQRGSAQRVAGMPRILFK